MNHGIYAKEKTMDSIFEELKTSLKDRPKRLDELNAWLFVTVNTARAMVDNTNKEDMQVIAEAEQCRTSAELQRWFDSIQGRYGREGLSYRSSPVYYYLCSLTAFFGDMPLGDEDRVFIKQQADMTDICCMKSDRGGVIVCHYEDMPCLEHEICGVAFVKSNLSRS